MHSLIKEDISGDRKVSSIKFWPEERGLWYLSIFLIAFLNFVFPSVSHTKAASSGVKYSVTGIYFDPFSFIISVKIRSKISLFLIVSRCFPSPTISAQSNNNAANPDANAVENELPQAWSREPSFDRVAFISLHSPPGNRNLACNSAAASARPVDFAAPIQKTSGYSAG